MNNLLEEKNKINIQKYSPAFPCNLTAEMLKIWVVLSEYSFYINFEIKSVLQPYNLFD